MLIFLDESYEPDGAGGFRYAYGGFGVGEREYRGMVASLFQCKQRHFKQAAGLSGEDLRDLRARFIATRAAPELSEVKADKLLARKNAEFHNTRGPAAGILMATEMLESMIQARAVVFGVLCFPRRVQDLHDAGEGLPVHLARLLERIDLWMTEQFEDEHAVVVPDTVHSQLDHELSTAMANYLFRASSGKRMRHIVPNAFWVDSKTTAGSQYADLVAHILMNSMRPAETRVPISRLWQMLSGMEFRSIDMRTRGIRRVQKTTGGSRAPEP